VLRERGVAEKELPQLLLVWAERESLQPNTQQSTELVSCRTQKTLAAK
jgi:hypothetical protein